MACSAIGAESRHDMIRIGRSLEITGMAAVAIVRCIGIFVFLLSGVTGFAIRYRVNAFERESLAGMQIKNIMFVLPILRCMTSLAIGSELPLMNIRMTINTGGAHHRKL